MDTLTHILRTKMNEPSVHNKQPTLAEFWDMLNAHDWYYNFSDDGRVWREGEKAQGRLRTIAAAGGMAYMTMIDAFSKHAFSGESWGTARAPKPERPTE